MAAEEFITQPLQLGVGGIDLKRALDLVSPLRLSRMTNVARDEEGRLRGRPGQRRLAWGPGANVHTVTRLQSALEGGEYGRFVGLDSELYWGREGQLEKIDGGFSGQAFTFVPGHPPLSGDSWMYFADSAKMVKVRSRDRLVLPIGLRAPVAAAKASVGSDNHVLVDPFESTVDWYCNAGTGGAPAVNVSTDSKAGAYSVSFESAVGSAVGGYYNFWGKHLVRDLSKLEGIAGDVPATDDDQFHVWLRMDYPAKIEEIRLYFVVSAVFSPQIVPGTNALYNTDAYVKSFIPATFTPFVEMSTPTTKLLKGIVVYREGVEYITSAEQERTGPQARTSVQQQDEKRAQPTRRLALGQGSWTEFGSPGQPLRRGEFLRIGGDYTRDWSNVTGLIVAVKTTEATAVKLALDDLYLRGGFYPDTSEPTSTGYDYRYRHVDPRTGAKSRWSPVMADEDKVDAVRQNIRLVPEAYGDPAIRQEFSRRGGTLPSNWYYVGTNTSDGGCAKDNTSDARAAEAGAESDDDYHQPVTTVDAEGSPVYGQPIPVIFGPVQGILLGLGDPYRPGDVYWTLPDEYDHWPLYNHVEVCSPDEELMNGGVFGAQAFAFSRKMLYPLLVSVIDGTVKATSSACAKGLAARQGMAVGLDGIYFVSSDGVWKTSGGTPTNLTDDYIEPLFRGRRQNGYAPIDWQASSVIRLALHLNELWFLFQDVDGNRQVWIYSVIFQFWRHYEFGWPISSLSPEEYGQPQLLLGASHAGRVYVHDGFSDDGLAIAGHIRTGALNMQLPRRDKLFGDVVLEMDLQGVQALVTVLANQEKDTFSALNVAPKVGQCVYIVDSFGPHPQLAKDVSIDVSWSALGVAPAIARGGPSFIPQPEMALGRITDWDELTGASVKILKGVLIEANTYGFPKAFNVMADGDEDSPVASFTLQTDGRQFKHVSFDSQFEARIVRLVPADEIPWMPYEIRWMFDMDPLELTLWQTQETDHGIHATQTLGESYITLKSSSVVTLTVYAYNPNGEVAVSGSVEIPSTGGKRQKCYVLLPTLKGVLFKYVFASTVAHRLYREESTIYVWPWGAEAPIPVQPFGTDNLDVARIVRDAEGAGLRGQRWLDTSMKAGQT